MRIAISGAHAVGKTALATALADAFPSYAVVRDLRTGRRDSGL